MTDHAFERQTERQSEEQSGREVERQTDRQTEGVGRDRRVRGGGAQQEDGADQP